MWLKYLVRLATIFVMFTACYIVACGGGDTAPSDSDGTGLGGNDIPIPDLSEDTGGNISGSGTPCQDDFDCPLGESCVSNICQITGSGGGTCISDVDCESGQVCSAGICTESDDAGTRPRQRCREDLDCYTGSFCEAGWCVEGSGSACNDQGDCKQGEICVAFRCKRGTPCISDADCKEGYVCITDKQQCVEELPTEGRLLYVDPQYIDFGAVAFGSIVSKKITLKNVGTENVEILQVAFDSLTSSAFTFDPSPPVSPGAVLAPNEVISFDVIYKPDDDTADIGSVEIYNNTLKPQISVPISTSYKGRPDFVVLDPKDDSIVIWPAGGADTWVVNFDLVEVNDIVDKKFKIKNRGNGSAILGIHSLDFRQEANLNSTQFSFEVTNERGEKLDPPLFFNPDEYAYITFTYHPNAKGEHKAIIDGVTNEDDINGDAIEDDGALIIELLGSAGIQPGLLGYSDNVLDFGLVEVGTTSTPKSFRLDNHSPDKPIHLEWVCMPSTPMNGNQKLCGEFELQDIPDTIYPSDSREMNVYFEPRTKGDKEKIIQIINDSENIPVLEISLIGEGGKASINILPSTTIVFPPTPFGTEAEPIELFISNGGTSPLTVQAVNGLSGSPEIYLSGQVHYQSGGTVSFPAELQPSSPPIVVTLGFKPMEKNKKYHAELVISHSEVGGKTATTVTIDGEGSDCQIGHIDLNADPNDGCEYACTVSDPNDVPELTPPFVDSNCDGIDGNIPSGVFVSTLGRQGAAGTIDDPINNLEEAISKAKASGLTQIYVSQGDYVLKQTLAMSAGISIYGGYNQSKKNASCPLGWCREETIYPNLRGPSASAAVSFANITDTTLINRIYIVGGDNNTTGGGNAIAVSVSNASNVEVIGCKIKSGLPLAGVKGTDAPTSPTPQMSGIVGSNGTDGKEDGWSFWGCGWPASCHCGPPGSGGGGGPAAACTNGVGYAGGSGGNGGSPSGQGDSGQAGSGPAGGAGGQPSSGAGSTPNPSIGPQGKDGDPGKAEGTYTAGAWKPTLAGTGGYGDNGSGGGGGAGGKGKDCGIECCPDKGGGGGGGGSGGCGGIGGGGGSGGYGSFAVFLTEAKAKIYYNEIRTSQGASGGAGGKGQTGGAGGAGGGPGRGYQDASPGGAGGTGQTGGTGGSGGGGAGGPSTGIFTDDLSTADQTGNTFQLGGGGAGGTSSGSSGPSGLNCAILKWDSSGKPTCSSN